MAAFTNFDGNLFYTTANGGTRLGSFTSAGSYAEIGSFQLSDGTPVSPLMDLRSAQMGKHMSINRISSTR